MPATAGGSTNGSSIAVLTRERPRNLRVAIRYAAGVPTSRINASAIPDVIRLSRSASVAWWSPSRSISSPGPTCRKMAAIGRVRKTSARQSAGEQEREPAQPQPECAGRKPLSSRIRWPSGPGARR